MKRPDQFFLPGLAAHGPGEIVALDEREAGHAARVKRQAPGDVIEVFDGAGRRARAVVTAADRRRGVSVRIECLAEDSPPAACIHLACAVPRGDRMETLLDMATQLGATRITPLLFEYSTPAGGREKPERWRRVLIEACKQSRRSYLPLLEEISVFDAWLARDAGTGCLRWLADPAGVVPSASDDARGGVVVVGPEGGLTGAEREAALAAGYLPVAFGGHVLRVETAAAAAVVAVNLSIRPARRE